MAGEMKVVNGRIKELSNKSGHYKPTQEHLDKFLTWLEEKNVALNFTVHYFDSQGQEKSKDAKDFRVFMKNRNKSQPGYDEGSMV